MPLICMMLLLLILLQGSLEQWQTSFLLAAVIASGTYLFYQLYATADVQPWNYPTKRLPIDDSQVYMETTTTSNLDDDEPEADERQSLKKH